MVVLNKYANYLPLLLDPRHNPRSTIPLTRKLGCFLFVKAGPRRGHGLLVDREADQLL